MKNLRKKNQQQQQNQRNDTVAADVAAEPGVATGNETSMKGKKNKDKKQENESCSKNLRKKGNGKKKKGTLRTMDETVETDNTGSHRQQKKIRHVPTNKLQVDNYQQFMMVSKD